MWATQLLFDNNGTAWSQASFAALKAKGLTTAEIDMPWGTIEPSKGTYTFAELDQELANASAAGLKLIPIFWYSGWAGSPAPWVTGHEVDSTGATSVAPVWWDTADQPAYFDYVTKTVAHVAGEAGYGGSILDYGFLDAQWDLNGGTSGWAQADIDEFHTTYLPATYGTVAAFNTKYSTSYTAFSQVPAAAQGQQLWGVYQAFRAWSVQDTYSRLTAAVRAVTASTPLYYYFGGHFGNAVAYANIPDIFFALAKQYSVTVIVDSAQATGLTLAFGSLARAYGVPLAQEWTAPDDSTQLAAQAVQWLSNYAIGLPEGAGEDFFIHDGTQKDVVGWPIYTSWVPNLQGITGAFPQQPVAVYLDFSQAYGNTSGGAVGSMEDAITSLWNGYQAGFAVVTSQEVANGTVKLSAYKAILPLNGVDANLTAYQSAGGNLLTSGSQMASYAPAYATLASSGVLQVVPAVAASGTSATVTLADINSSTAYNAAVTFNIAGLGLTAGSYHVVDASGNVVPQAAVSGGVCTAPSVQPAQLVQWNIVTGAAPAGTSSPAACGGGTTYPNLAASFDNVGITADANTAPGNFDGGASSFSETALTTAHAGPGAAVTASGVTFTVPNVASGAADNTIALGQKISVSGSGTLGFLVSASYGPASGTGTITYTDGSTQSYSLTAPDWWSTTAPSGGAVAVSSAYQNRPGNTTYSHTADLFSVTVPLAAGKSLASVTLPSGPALATGNPVIHVFAMAATGAGTATPVISLRAHANGDYVTADNAGASPLIANRTAIGAWESFDLITNPDGSVSLRAHANNEYVCADNAGANPLIANRTAIGAWESFDLIHNADGSVSFKAHANGDYVTADNAGASPLIANRTAIGPWEEFDLIDD